MLLCRMFVSRFLVLTTTCPGTGEDRAEGASFWYAFLTPFSGPKKIFFFKRNDAEAYVWPKSEAMVLCMARPGRGQARPQNLSFCTWRGLSEVGRGPPYR